MDEARNVLKDTFGFPGFKLSQEKVVERLLVQKANCLVLYPTGGGKSLCYQVPALCLPGLTLVISPLIALMKDQVDVLRSKGVKAANLDSTLNIEESRAVKDSVLDGTLKLLYVAPERLNNEAFVEMMRSVDISMLAVDESHCISQWGASFRPDYLKIARFAQEFKIERCLCLTATATKKIALDICESFDIDPENGVFRVPMYRPNLSFLVKTAPSLKDKLNQLIPILTERTGPAIVYVTLQSQAEQTAYRIREAGLEAKMYHAGMPSNDRQSVQDYFMASTKGIVVATIAFGMGIDKNNIRQVIHLYLPKTLENYSQEVGRAGRDGLPSTCILFLCVEDIPVLEGFCRGDTCSKESVQLWLGEVMRRDEDLDGTISANHYEQSKIYDIRSNTLGLLYAELELKYNFLRAVTPFYSVYSITPRSADFLTYIEKDNDPAAVAVRKAMRAKGKNYEIDVVLHATQEIPREQLAQQITRWELGGLAETKGSQVRARYKILQPLPTSTVDIEKIAEEIYQGMLTREEDAVQRLHRVIEFATMDDCLAQTLAAYFGDEDAVPNGMCGACTFCRTGAGTEFDPSIETHADPSRVRAVLAACAHRHDPRLLTRLAFGITSPLLTSEKLTRHVVFGSMGTVDFNVLLKVFTEACEAAGGQRASGSSAPPPSATKTGAKRTYSQASSSASRGGSKGTKPKRGRYN